MILLSKLVITVLGIQPAFTVPAPNKQSLTKLIMLSPYALTNVGLFTLSITKS